MTIRHFHIFMTVCETLSMTQAAKVLYMTQPSVSQAVAELEAHYGVRLFERLGRRLSLTAAGERLLGYARQAAALDSRIESAMRSSSESLPLRIGASVTIGETLLIPILKRMREKEARRPVVSEIHNTAELARMVEQDQLDAALVEGAVRADFLRMIPFAEDELVLVTAPGYGPDSAVMTPMRCGELSFFLREAGSGTRSLFEETMAALHIPLRVSGVYNNTASIKQAVLAGLGAAVLSRRLVVRELAAGTLQERDVEGMAMRRLFQIIHHKDKYMSPPLSSLIRICREMERIPT